MHIKTKWKTFEETIRRARSRSINVKLVKDECDVDDDDDNDTHTTIIRTATRYRLDGPGIEYVTLDKTFYSLILKQEIVANAMKSSRTDSRVEVWKFSKVSGTDRQCVKV